MRAARWAAGGGSNAGRRGLRASPRGAAAAGTFSGEVQLCRKGGCLPGIHWGSPPKPKLFAGSVALRFLPVVLQGQRPAGQWEPVAASRDHGKSGFIWPPLCAGHRLTQKYSRRLKWFAQNVPVLYVVLAINTYLHSWEGFGWKKLHLLILF